MENMRSLADQLRRQLENPEAEKSKRDKTENSAKPVNAKKNIKPKELESSIVSALLNFDNSRNKSMVHVRFDEKTVGLMNRFKMATGLDVTKLVAFAVQHLFDTCPELKTIIKQFIQNTEL